jgi:hypothetical protein
VLPPLPPPEISHAELVRSRGARRNEEEGADQKRARLRSYILDALRKGHNPYKAKHIYKVTYSVFPPADWLALELWHAKLEFRKERQT